MNIKKALSVLTAAALSIGSFAALAVTASAEDNYTYMLEYVASESENTNMIIGRGINNRENNQYKFQGQYNTNTDNLTFNSNATNTIKEIFGGSSTATTISEKYSSCYINYIGLASKSFTPYFYISYLPEGTYTMYVLGYDNNGVRARIGNTIYSAKSMDGTQIAYKGSETNRTLRVYEISLSGSFNNAKVELLPKDDSTDWMPDLYGVVIKGTSSTAPTLTKQGTNSYLYTTKNSVFNGFAGHNAGESNSISLATAPNDNAKKAFGSSLTTGTINYICGKNPNNGQGSNDNKTKNLNITVNVDDEGEYYVYYLGKKGSNDGRMSVSVRTSANSADITEVRGYEDKDWGGYSLYTTKVYLYSGSNILVFDNDQTWLPDLHAIAVVGTSGKDHFDKAEINMSAENIEAGRQRFFDKAKGDPADAYMTSIDFNSQYSAKNLSWYITNNENAIAKYGDVNTTITGGTVYFGLIITGSQEDLDTITKVELR